MKKVFIILLLIILIGGIMFKTKKEIEISEIKSMHYSYTTGTMIHAYVIYDVEYKNNQYILKIKPNGVPDENAKKFKMEKEDIQKIEKVLKKYKVQKWNGFNKTDNNVLDGNSFSINIHFMDDSSIYASGYMMYPKNYREVKTELEQIFSNYK